MRTFSLLLLTGLLVCAPIRAQLRPLPPEELQALANRRSERIAASLAFVENAKFRYGLDADSTFKVTANPTSDEFGILHARFQQFYRGIAVGTGQILTHLNAQDSMLDPNVFALQPKDVATTPGITVQQAIQSIKADLAASDRALQNMPDSALKVSPELRVDPLFERVFQPNPGLRSPGSASDPNADEYETRVNGFQLIYQALAAPADGASPDFLFTPTFYSIDAATGRVLRKSVAQSEADAVQSTTATGYPVRRRQVKIQTTKNLTKGYYELSDQTRGASPGNHTRSANNLVSQKYADSSVITDGNNSWGNNKQYSSTMPLNETTAQSPAVDVHWGGAKTWDLLNNIFGQKGLDGDSTALDLRVHSEVNYNDARYSYSEQAAFFGDGTIDPDPAKSSSPNIPLTTVAHELGHGLWGFYVSSANTGEASGLNEGHGDIMGSITNFYTNVSSGSGLFLDYADDVNYFSGRSYNPSSYPSNPTPAPFNGYTGRRYWQSDMATLEVHVVGCAYGHMFAILVEGAPKDPSLPTYSKFFPNGMAGIGLTAASKIWYSATLNFAGSAPDFASMRTAWVNAASTIFGSGSKEHVATQNAWAAINVGTPFGNDYKAPVLSTPVLELDENEGRLFVTVNADDDTGVSRVEAGYGPIGATRMMPPYKLLIDISALKPGKHSVFVRAYDSAGHMSEKTVDFQTQGVKQLLKNGGFEAGSSDWTVTSDSMTNNNVSGAFLGGGYLRFRGDKQAASQSFTIPTSASSAKVSFRYRVGGPEYLDDESLKVELIDGSLISHTIKTISSAEITIDNPAHHYKRVDYNLSSYKGQKVTLRFTSQMVTSSTRFSIDAVSATYQSNGSLSLIVDNDEAAGVLGLRAFPIEIVPEALNRVEFRVDGSTIISDSGSLNGVTYSLVGLPAATYNVQAFAIGIDNKELGKSPVVPIYFSGKKNNLLNGGFEQDSANWLFSGPNAKIFTNNGEGQQFYAHSGTKSARVSTAGASGSSEYSQLAQIPALPLLVNVSFYLRIKSSGKDPYDTLSVGLYSVPDNKLLVSIYSGSGSSLVDSAKTIKYYTHLSHSFSLSEVNSVKGKQVKLRFIYQQNNSTVTDFYVDDVSVQSPELSIENH